MAAKKKRKKARSRKKKATVTSLQRHSLRKKLSDPSDEIVQLDDDFTFHGPILRLGPEPPNLRIVETETPEPITAAQIFELAQFRPKKKT
jgi:hypothetical protein